MTKKDYEAIAEIIAKVMKRDKFGGQPTTREEAVHLMAIHLSTYFGDQNPRFNRDTFYKACGF